MCVCVCVCEREREVNMLVPCCLCALVLAKTIEYPRHVTRIVLNGEKCNAQYGRSIAGSPAF